MKNTTMFLICAVLSAAPAMAFNVHSATVYLPFEGDNQAAQPTEVVLDSPCWQHNGNADYGYFPQWAGSLSGGYPTISLNGLKGQAWSGEHLTHLTASNAIGWGNQRNTNNPLIELNTMNIWSFTITGWIKSSVTNARIIRCPAFEINYTGGRLQVKPGRFGDWHTSEGWVEDDIQKGNFSLSQHPDHEWMFFAVTYDGTVSWNNATGTALEDNLRIYYGSKTQPVTLDSVFKAKNNDINGRLTRDGDGSVIIIGNAGIQSTRPWPGLIDEIRVWAGGPGPEQMPSWRYVLGIEELEQVRLYDAPLYNCAGVKAKGLLFAGDIDGDCKVTIDDLYEMAANWLACNRPGDVGCVENW